MLKYCINNVSYFGVVQALKATCWFYTMHKTKQQWRKKEIDL